MSVHEIKRVSLMDVPGKLRELAAAFEKRPQELRTAIVVIGYETGHVAVRGYGERTTNLEAVGWLHRGLTMMTEGCGTADNFVPEPHETA